MNRDLSVGPQLGPRTVKSHIQTYMIVQHVLDMTVIHGWEEVWGVEAGGQGAMLTASMDSRRMRVFVLYVTGDKLAGRPTASIITAGCAVWNHAHQVNAA